MNKQKKPETDYRTIGNKLVVARGRRDWNCYIGAKAITLDSGKRKSILLLSRWAGDRGTAQIHLSHLSSGQVLKVK